METLGDRLKELRGDEPQTFAARLAGISQQLWSKLERNIIDPMDSAKLVSIAKAYRVNLDWLASGRGPKAFGLVLREEAPPYLVEDKFFVTKVTGAHLAAGNGEVVYDFEELDDSHAFKSEWMRKEGLDPKRCRLWEVRGESMWPTIPSGSLVLINSAEREPRTGNIYALVTEDGLRLKRLIKRSDGVWEIHSDNPLKTEYPTEVFAPGAIAVMGRVRWSATTY